MQPHTCAIKGLICYTKRGVHTHWVTLKGNTMNYPPVTLGGPQHDDIVELAKAWAGTTVAYAIVLTGAANLLSIQIIEALLVSAIVCGLGFVVHELAHRQVARRYGATAHFAADMRWLGLSLLLSFTGIFIAAPGAVWHTGVNDARRLGHIAWVGPVSNLLLSLLFLLLYPIAYIVQLDFDLLLRMGGVGVGFNAWLGLFNLIPGGPFDGAKVLAWSTPVYVATVVVAGAMAFGLARQDVLIQVWGAIIRMAFGVS